MLYDTLKIEGKLTTFEGEPVPADVAEAILDKLMAALIDAGFRDPAAGGALAKGEITLDFDWESWA